EEPVHEVNGRRPVLHDGPQGRRVVGRPAPAPRSDAAAERSRTQGSRENARPPVSRPEPRPDARERAPDRNGEVVVPLHTDAGSGGRTSRAERQEAMAITAAGPAQREYDQVHVY